MTVNHQTLRDGRKYGDAHTHDTAQEARDCQDAFDTWEYDQETDPDLAYERHLEDAGYNEARLQEDMERAMGVRTYEEEMAYYRSIPDPDERHLALWGY